MTTGSLLRPDDRIRLCPAGHGELRRSSIMDTGVFPGWSYHCRQYWTCPASDFAPIRVA